MTQITTIRASVRKPTVDALVLKRATLDLCQLIDDKAPANVIGAAQHVIDKYKFGEAPEQWAFARIMAHCAKRARQDRYGR